MTDLIALLGARIPANLAPFMLANVTAPAVRGLPHGPDCIALFSGVSADHALGPLLYTDALVSAVGTRRRARSSSSLPRPPGSTSGSVAASRRSRIGSPRSPSGRDRRT